MNEAQVHTSVYIQAPFWRSCPLLCLIMQVLQFCLFLLQLGLQGHQLILGSRTTTITICIYDIIITRRNEILFTDWLTECPLFPDKGTPMMYVW